VLPLNAAAEQVFEINLPGLEPRADQLVNFQACYSTRHGRCRPGDVLPWDADAFHALPPLQAIIRTAHGVDVGSDRSVPVGGENECAGTAADLQTALLLIALIGGGVAPPAPVEQT
jgi:hypothetical protein